MNNYTHEFLTRNVGMPPMPTAWDEYRACVVEAMHAVMDNDWADVAAEYMAGNVDEQTMEVWGRPDTSDNVHRDMATALSQPGHYTRQWKVLHPLKRADRVIGPGGVLERGGFLARMPFVEMMAWGLGDYIVHVLATGPDDVSYTPVRPDRVWYRGAPEDPSKPVEFWHVRRRWVGRAERYLWCWDKYDISDPTNPRFAVETAEPFKIGEVEYQAGQDLTLSLFEHYLAKTGATEMVGDAYRWRNKANEPVIPYAILRTVDSGRPWNYHARYGSFLATLVISLVSTYVMHAARDASGSMVLLVDIALPAAEKRNLDERGAPAMARLTAGSMMAVKSAQGATNGGKVVPVGPGTNLQALAMYLHQLKAQAAQRFGVGGGEAIRNDANPTSASALLISEKKKMEATRAADELFRKFDRKVLYLTSAVLRAWGVDVPEDGYSIQYYQPASTPAEMTADREQEQYDVENGYRSKVEIYMDRHPGLDRKGAIQALARIAADRMAVDRAVAEMTAESTTPTEPSPDVVAMPAEEVDDIIDDIETAQDLLERLADVDGAPSELSEVASVLAEIGAMMRREEIPGEEESDTDAD
jgi:hypothetical protein